MAEIIKAYRFNELSDEQKKLIPEKNRELIIATTEKFFNEQYREDIQCFLNDYLNLPPNCFEIKIVKEILVVNVQLDFEEAYYRFDEKDLKAVEKMAEAIISKMYYRLPKDVMPDNLKYFYNIFERVIENTWAVKSTTYITYFGFLQNLFNEFSVDATNHYINVVNNPQYVYDYYVGYSSVEKYYGKPDMFRGADKLFTDESVLLNVEIPKE